MAPGNDLFPDHDGTSFKAAAPGAPHPTGILPAQGIHYLLREGEIWASKPIDDDQVQPASLDLRLGPVAYRLRASFLPGPERGVMERVKELSLHEIDLSEGAVLEQGCVYLVPLIEALALSQRTSARANPKSSTGRLDVFTRVITDFGAEFDEVAPGYKGHLYLEIVPRTFPILVRMRSRLAQLRFRRGSPIHSDAETKRLHERTRLVDRAADIRNGVAVTVNLKPLSSDGVIGFRAKRHSGLVDVDLRDGYDPLDFWEPLIARPGRGLILDPDEFYILASREFVHVPPTHAAEMIPYNPLVGEFRVHYAGFFDPGFGDNSAEGEGSRAVLEVRSHDVPFLIEHGQTIARLIYERLTDKPAQLYGEGIGSSYQRQGLKLSKHFKAVEL